MLKVSIIVPVYNVEDYLRECLDSLCRQTLKDIEIILVNDGSTDRSGEICDAYKKQDTRIKVLHKKNGGQSSARNLGLQNARGKYILFVDSDDYIRNNTCEVLYQAAIRNQADIVHGDTINDEEKLKDPSFRRMQGENQTITAIEFLKDALMSETYDIVPWLNLMKRSLLDTMKLSFFEGCFYEDQLYNLQMLTLRPDARIIKIRFPFYFYRMDRVGSTTNEISLRKVSDAVTIINEMYRYCIEKDAENIELYQAVMMISLFQYSRIWQMASISTRMDKSIRIDKGIIRYAMAQRIYYPDLYRKLEQFFHLKWLMAMKHDIKRLSNN